MISDLHTHSDTSPDNVQTIREIYEAAVRKGLEYICITNHHEFVPQSVKEGYVLDSEKIRRYKEDFKILPRNGKISVFFGTEIGYCEDRERDIREFIKAHQFDFVIGSVHWVDDFHIPDSRTRFKLEDKPELQKEVIEKYFSKLKKAISSGLFDVIGHIDVYKKVIPEPPFEDLKCKEFSKRKLLHSKGTGGRFLFEDQWKEVADLLVEYKVGFEINTSYKNYFGEKPVPSIYPSQEIIKLFLERGVKIITTGSDGHSPDRIGDQIDLVEEMLRRFGVKKICYFKNRKVNFVKL